MRIKHSEIYPILSEFMSCIYDIDNFGYMDDLEYNVSLIDYQFSCCENLSDSPDEIEINFNEEWLNNRINVFRKHIFINGIKEIIEPHKKFVYLLKSKGLLIDCFDYDVEIEEGF